MKSMVRKVVVSFIVAVSIISCISMTAFAGAPRWSHWTMLTGDIEIVSDNACLITVICDCSAREADNVKITCELQQYNGSWKTIKSWSKSVDETSISLEKNYAIAKNYSYRLKVTAKAYKGTKLLETVTSYFEYGYYQ